jgi:inhibitor of KinA
MTPAIAPLGDSALLITVGAAIDEATHRRVRAVTQRIERAGIPGVIELVPAYASVAVHYDPLRLSCDAATAQLAPLLEHLDAADPLPPRVVEIPVRYGGDDGPDLADLAERHGLSPAEVVRIHTGGDYLVHLIGFAPGFPYLGGLDERLATPRRETPRTRVPAGSVAIGGGQTGVYPFESPGGWHLIGRTPLAMFDVHRDPPAMLSAGDRVRFRALP